MLTEDGFIGTSLRREEYVEDCSDIDDIIVFTSNGDMIKQKLIKCLLQKYTLCFMGRDSRIFII